MRDGVAPSYAWLPHGDWPTLGAYLAVRFPMVPELAWRARMARGDVRDDGGRTLGYDDCFVGGQRIFYYRERIDEPPIPFEETVLYQDDELMVIDKPHFVPVTPGGRFLHESLLVRLRRKTGLQSISPIHRLDRETAGVILFSVNPATRPEWQALFRFRRVHKVYEALAPLRDDLCFPCRVSSRIVRDEQFFRVKEVPGEPNAFTQIALISRAVDLGLYRLVPETGKMHQLRIHMSSLGIPILNDSFYPFASESSNEDFSSPLKLLARSITFVDPVRGIERSFQSVRSL
ncbi:MAG: pseudouridine synthase [Oxalobacteraceae bacterium]|jgi:tRNA pseudouridine32 synthase/23S rRNA pseudouridine746 synthase|nr:pseudouridine synthase [Oxalobacteraceae bacterium]